MFCCLFLGLHENKVRLGGGNAAYRLVAAGHRMTVNKNLCTRKNVIYEIYKL